MPRGESDSRIVGRNDELAEIDRLLAAGQSGMQVLVIEGEPGIGKTTLWREAVRRAEAAGHRVLSSRPAQAEAKLSYAGLSDLLDSLPARVFASLPDVQRQALDLALLRSSSGHAEPLAVAAGTRAAIIGAAREQPVLVAIDDTQWLDSASAAAVAYALRRISGGSVTAVVCTRPPPPGRRSRFEVPDAHVLRLGQLTVAATYDVLKSRLQLALPRPLVVRLHESCKGNPFYALEIARELAASPVGPGQPLPVPVNLRHVVRRRMARLSAEAKEMLLVSAAAGEPTRALLAGVLQGDPTVALQEAESADVIVLEGDLVRFAHPLYAAAIYAAAPRATREWAHRALAEAAQDGEERARHLAMATEGPSADVAAELERSAMDVRRRGAALAAAGLLSEAARLTPSDSAPLRHRRELGAAQAFFDGADSDAAREILERLRETMAPGVDRARARLLMALIHSYDGEHTAAKDACLEALQDAKSDSRLLAETNLRYALVNYDDAVATRRSSAEARRLVEQDAGAPSDLVAAALLDDAYQGLYAGEGLAAGQVERALTRLPSHGRTWLAQRAQVVAYLYAKYTDDLVRARELMEWLVALRRDEGDDYEAALTLRHLAEVECWLGNWRRAAEVAAEADDLATHRAVTLYLRALAGAHLGDAENAREWAEEGLALSQDNAWYRALNLSVLGFLALSLGDVGAAAMRLDAAAAEVATMGMADPVRFRFDGDYVEALVALGRAADAEACVADLAQRAAQTPRPWTLVMQARGDALVRAAAGDMDGAAVSIGTALREQERLPMPFERARTLLVKGEIERRSKRRGAAKAALELALVEFDRLGAPLWADRARRELDRIGLRRAPSDLTPSERRVAELAAAGLTNRQVAAQLFLSPKTVEANLARAYRKLGIRSRAELGARFGSEGPSRPQT